MIHFVGYAGLILNLISMTMSRVFLLRFFSLLSNVICIIYGILLNAPPLIIGCSVAVLIHAYFLYKLLGKNKIDNTETIDSWDFNSYKYHSNKRQTKI